MNENKDIALSEVYEKIMGLERQDYATPAEKAEVFTTDEGAGIRIGDYGRMPTSLPMTGYAREQLNQRWTGFNTFSKELHRLEHDDLQLRTLNELLQHDPRKLVIRTMQPNGQRVARAVVSDAFKPIDDNILVPDILDIVGEKDNALTWRSLGGQITDTNSYLRFITREPQINLTVSGRERALHIGFQYSNSEVGRGRAQFSAFFFDSFCENGCVFGQMTVANVSYTHRGTRISTDFGMIMEERMQQVELAAIRGAVVDATRLTVQGAYIPEVKRALEASLAREVPAGEDAAFIREVAKRVGLTEEQGDQALAMYDGTRSQYGVQAAITRLAQDAPNYEGRQELERAGGKVLEMNDRTWNSITALVA